MVLTDIDRTSCFHFPTKVQRIQDESAFISLAWHYGAEYSNSSSLRQRNIPVLRQLDVCFNSPIGAGATGVFKAQMASSDLAGFRVLPNVQQQLAV